MLRFWGLRAEWDLVLQSLRAPDATNIGSGPSQQQTEAVLRFYAIARFSAIVVRYMDLHPIGDRIQ
jgi:hypothetical protein